jgi:NitT/TauT family transport system substrate-binding protein
MRKLKLILATMLIVFAGLTTTAYAKDKIVFAYIIDPFHEAMLYALKNGIVTSDIVEVDAQAVGLSALIQGTASKQFDLVETAAGSLPKGLDRGLEVRIAGTGLRAKNGHGSDIWVNKDSPIQSAEDLKGKTVGFPSLGSTSVTLVRIALWKGKGLDISVEGGDFEYLESPSPTLASTLSTGRVDAAMLALSYGYRAEKSGEFRSIMNSNATNYEVFGVPPVTAVIVGYPEKLDVNPEAYSAALDLMRQSRDYAIANKDEVFATVAEAENIDVEFFEKCLEEYYDFPVAVSDGDMTAIQKLWEFSAELGLLENVPDIEDIVWEGAIRE